jgi:hypothetical protein
MPDPVDTALRTTLNELFPSLERLQPDWDRIVADAGVVRSGRRRGRLVFRFALAGAAVVAIALGVLSLLPGSGPSAVTRARAALTGPREAILHAVALGSFSNQDGGTTTWTIETWQHNSPPYDSRWVVLGGIQRPESAMAGGVRAFYDARTDTIYTADEPVGKPRAARGGLDPLAATFSVEELRELLRSADAREAGRVRLDGRDAIRIVATQPAVTLLVDAETYEPLEWHIAGNGRDVTMRVHAYEWLPATAENETLLSLNAQHPGAAVRAAPTDDAARADAGGK